LENFAMSGSPFGFRRPGVACVNCTRPFSLFLFVKKFRSIEKLSDPFQAKCPYCGHEDDYPKSGNCILANASAIR